MLLRNLSGWLGGATLGVAVAGAAAVLAQPQLEVDRAGEKPVERPAVADDFSEAFRRVAREVSPAVVSIEARTAAQRLRGQTQFDEEEFGGFGPRVFPGLPPELQNDPRFEEFFRRFGELPQQRRGRIPREMIVPPRQSKGSGVVIDSSGVILTNSHVVNGASEVVVRLADGREYVATEVQVDPKSDVAVVKIEAEDLTPAAVGDSDAAEVGDWVLAIGSPFGLDTTVTAGIIGAKNRGPGINEREDYLQTDAAINPGNSGGPLVNLNGQVIGINTAISSRGGGFDGVGFAIPINMAKWVAEQLLESGKVERSYLGVGIQPVTSGLAGEFGVSVGQGVIVNNVFPDGPAEEAGLQIGDVIVEVDGKPVTNPLHLQGIVERLEAGRTYAFKIVRDGEKKTIDVTVAGMPADYGTRLVSRQESRRNQRDAAAFDDLGMEVAPLSDDLRRELGFDEETTGVVITRVEPGSPAQLAGLERGLVIERIGRRTVTEVSEFREAIEAAKEAGRNVVLLVRSPQGGRFVTLKAN